MEGVQPEDAQVTTGAAEALLLLFTLAAEPGANILVPSLGFPSFYEIPRGLGLEIRHYHQRRENQFRIDLDEIKKLADARTRILLVNAPHNPTGATLSDEELAALHDFSAERGIQFVCDQVYHPVYHGRPTASVARLPHAVVLSDFSKALCLAGLRLGWIGDRDHRPPEQYPTAHPYFTVSRTAPGEPLAPLTLPNPEKVFDRLQNSTTANPSHL